MKPSLTLAAWVALSLTACIGAATENQHQNPPQASDKAITSFALRAADNPVLTADVSATLTGTAIALTVPHGTLVTHLVPAIVENGASLSPPSGAAQDFTQPVAYTVTAADGSKQAYTVTVTIAPSTASSTKDITQFSILGVDGTISGTGIALTVPNGTNLTSLVPTIVTTGIGVLPASGIAHDFSSPAQYVVTAEDGTMKTYTVTVTAAPSDSKDITQFSINGVNGSINGNAISLTLPVGTNLTSLVPSIVHTGASISPASGAAANFTNPVSYTVTAANGSTRVYVVTATAVQAINLASAIITDGSASDVASWPQTATITAVNIIGNGTAISVDFDKKDGPGRWADECDLPGFAPDCLQYTIWVFEYVGGQWYGTGAIEMWYARGDTGENQAGGTLGAQITQNWVYYSGVMGAHALASGEQIGIMVTTGDERRKDNKDFAERSDVVMLTLP